MEGVSFLNVTGKWLWNFDAPAPVLWVVLTGRDISVLVSDFD